MTLRRGVVDSTEACVVDALAGHAAPVVLDRWPIADAYDTSSVSEARTSDALDTYCRPPLMADAAAFAQATKEMRSDASVWWTDVPFAVCESPAMGQLLVEAVERSTRSRACDAERHNTAGPAEDGEQETGKNEHTETLHVEGDAIAHTLYTNARSHNASLQWKHAQGSCEYVLPPRTAALLTDLLPEHAQERGLLPNGILQVLDLDVVLLDPPWPNKSAERVQRMRGYGTMPDMYDLWRLRPTLEPLLAYRPLVALWITNHVHRFVRDKFFPGLGLAYVGCWAWLKLASSGEPLYTLARPQRRKPYELLVLGAADGTAIPPCLLMSVALAHSQKPYVARTSFPPPTHPALLLEATGRSVDHAVVVELFARHTPRNASKDGWHISVGNEALRFNARYEYEPASSSPPPRV